jgi:hypothetical protein
MKRRMKIQVTSPAASNRPRPIDSPDGRFVKIAIFACKFYFTPPQIKPAVVPSHSVGWPRKSADFDASVAVNSNTVVVPANAGVVDSPGPISDFIPLIWKNRLNKRSILV